MRAEKTSRGFIWVKHQKYAVEAPLETRLVQESSAIDFDLDDGLDNPGSSYLWIGEDHHLNRKEVSDLAKMLNYWLENKRLPLE